MSPYGSITVTHRAEVRVPDDVFQAFGHTEEYERFSIDASSGTDNSGQDTYDGVVEYAEHISAQRCLDFIDRWHNRILQWKGQL